MIGGPDPIDVHVGSRVRLRRTLLGLSQTKLGKSLGLTFQQIQKYERGANRIGSSRLYKLSKILDVPVSFFFEEYVSDKAGGKQAAEDQEPVFSETARMSRRETLELVRAYYRITNSGVRKTLFDLIVALAKR